jgi:hypothetical protein
MESGMKRKDDRVSHLKTTVHQLAAEGVAAGYPAQHRDTRSPRAEKRAKPAGV